MGTSQVERLKEIFAAIVTRPAEERSRFLDEACRDDPTLRREVESLLAHSDTSTKDFLDKPVVEARQVLTPTNSAAAAAASADATPKYVGPYRIIEHLGHGGMGTVFKAEQRSPVRRTVALKLIKPGFDSAEVIARFESERQALARMDHPNVAKVLDAGTDELGRPYFVMEYVPGVPLTKFADDNKLSIRQRLELFVQACDAISHAHTKALIHRDIKSSNVLAYLVAGKPHLKVIDFGIAKALTGDRLTDRTFNTVLGQAIGTFASMSPEQANGSPDIDTRTDVYSLGVLLYELIAGVKPFEEADFVNAVDADFRRMIREVEPPRPSTRLHTLGADASQRVAAARQAVIGSLAKELRSELEWVPLKAMRKERERRYASPAELAQDLENYLADRPLVAGPESRAYRLRKFVSRNRGRLTAVAASLLLFCGAGAAYIHGTRLEQRKTEMALAEAEKQRLQAMRQEAAAEQQRKAATTVNAFLAKVLTSGDPSRLYGDKVTVLQAVQSVIRDLNAGNVPMDERTEASLRSTLGATLSWLSHHAEAEPNLRKSLNIRRKLLAPDDPELTSTLTHLAHVLVEQGKLAQAMPLYQEAVRNNLKARPAGDLSVASDMVDLTELQLKLKLDADAELMLRDALKIYRRALGPDHPILARYLSKLANLMVARGKPAEAKPLFEEAIAIFRKAPPPHRSELADAMVNLADLLASQERLSDAIARYREGLDLQCRPRINERSRTDLAADDPGRRSLATTDGSRPGLPDALKVMFWALTPQDKSPQRPYQGRGTITAAKLAQALTRAGQTSEAAAVRSEFGLPAPSTRPGSGPERGPAIE